MPPTTLSDAPLVSVSPSRATAAVSASTLTRVDPRPAVARVLSHAATSAPTDAASLSTTTTTAVAATAAATAVTTTTVATTPTRPAAPKTDNGYLAHRIGRLAVLSLPVGVAVAILTTRDTTWWQLHFSQLGTHTDFSGRTFNSITIFSGFFLAAYGVLIAVALPRGIRRRASRAFRGSIVSAGLFLTGVGLVPIPVSPVGHDVIATALGLSFVSTVATGLAIPGRSRRFRRATMLCVALLATGMGVLTAGFITLALFEFVAFVTMGFWLLSLPRALSYAPAPAPVPVTTTAPASAEWMAWQNPWPIPSPSRSNGASIPPAPSKPRAGCKPAPISPRASRVSSAQAGYVRAKAATLRS